RPENVPFTLAFQILLDEQLKRRAVVPMPDLDRVDAMPFRDLAPAKEEVYRSRACSSVRFGSIAKCLPKMSAFWMRYQTEFGNEAIGLAHSAENVTLSG